MLPVNEKVKSMCENIKRLGFDVRQHEDGTFQSVMGIYWKNVPSTHEITDKTHFESFEAAKAGCQGLFEQWRSIFDANDVPWGFGDRFDPEGSERRPN